MPPRPRSRRRPVCLPSGTRTGCKPLAPSRVRIVDKMPDNYHFLGLISVLFPRARLVHCRRDLRDVALSCWMTDFGSVSWACNPDHIAAHFADYRRLMDHWQEVCPCPS